MYMYIEGKEARYNDTVIMKTKPLILVQIFKLKGIHGMETRLCEFGFELEISVLFGAHSAEAGSTTASDIVVSTIAHVHTMLRRRLGTTAGCSSRNFMLQYLRICPVRDQCHAFSI